MGVGEVASGQASGRLESTCFPSAVEELGTTKCLLCLRDGNKVGSGVNEVIIGSVHTRTNTLLCFQLTGGDAHEMFFHRIN